MQKKTYNFKFYSLPSIILCLMLLDSLLVYYGRIFFGQILPVNMTIPILLTILVIFKGIKYVLPPEKYTIYLLLCSTGFIMGAIVIQEYGFPRVLEVPSAASALLAGYVYSRWNDNPKLTANIFLLVGLLYGFVCTAALLKVSPHYFPMIIKLWAFNGTLIERPEITTDQNFQIFYFLPAVLAVVSATKIKDYILWGLATILGLYVISALQTRSGLLVLISAAMLSIISPLFIKKTSKKKIIILFSVISVTTLLSLPIIIKYAHNIIIRFTETDYSTGLGRLHGFTFLFEKIYNPLWWIPQGNSYYKELTGNIPHSNLTAIYLDGGLISLVFWFLLSLYPLYKLGVFFIKKKLNQSEAMIFIGSISMLILQLSLNVPLMDIIWLWSGLTLGTYIRLISRKTDNEKEIDLEIKTVTTKQETKFDGVTLR